MQTILWVVYLRDLLAGEDVIMDYLWDQTLIQCTLKYFTSWSSDWKSPRTWSYSSPLISTGHDAEKQSKIMVSEQKQKWGTMNVLNVTWRMREMSDSNPYSWCCVLFFFQYLRYFVANLINQLQHTI